MTVSAESSGRSKVRRTVDLLKPSVKRLDKPTTDPERPIRNKPTTPDPGGPKPLKRQESKTSNVVLQIVKKSHAPGKPPAPALKAEQILIPTTEPYLSPIEESILARKGNPISAPKSAEAILVPKKAESFSVVVPAKATDSLLPPTLRQKSVEKKLTKNINNNDVWTNGNEVKTYRKRITSVPAVPVR